MSPDSWIWGIDVAVAHLEFAVADMHSDLVEVESLITRNDETEGNKLGLIDRQVRIYANQLAGIRPPHVIFVEQPSGAVVNLRLISAYGVVMAALAEALAFRFDYPVSVWSIPSGKWKKQTLGYGNASKEQVAAWVTAQRHEFDGQDQADAICIALAGRSIIATGRWEAKAA